MNQWNWTVGMAVTVGGCSCWSFGTAGSHLTSLKRVPQNFQLWDYYTLEFLWVGLHLFWEKYELIELASELKWCLLWDVGVVSRASRLWKGTGKQLLFQEFFPFFLVQTLGCRLKSMRRETEQYTICHVQNHLWSV